MEITHHGLRIVLPDAWWSEAEMGGFKPKSTTYRCASADRRIIEIRIDDIEPVLRAPGVGIFNDCLDTGRTARERVVKILRGFQNGDTIPPVEIVNVGAVATAPFKLEHGTHRLYCSLAARFTHVPAVQGSHKDWRA